MSAGRILAAVALVVGSAATAAAQTATQTVNFSVASINRISVSSATASVTVDQATAGSAPTSANNTGTLTYAITTNQTNQKITGHISTGGDMPSGVTLQVALGAPTGGTTSAASAGAQTLVSGGANAVNLVTNISKTAESGLSLLYTLAATVAADPVTSSRVITYTVTAGP